MFGLKTGCIEKNVSDISQKLTGATNRNTPEFLQVSEMTGEDPAAHLRRIVEVIQGSDRHHNAFRTWVEMGNISGLFVFQNYTVQIQSKDLLWDVPTRWVTTEKMIKRCISMRIVSLPTSFRDLIWMTIIFLRLSIPSSHNQDLVSSIWHSPGKNGISSTQ